MPSPSPPPIFLFGRIICPPPSEPPTVPSVGESFLTCDANEASESKPSCITVDAAATAASVFPLACDDGSFQSGNRVRCPRCDSYNTKFCYFNNYNIKQPRHFCRNCQRYWTAGGSLRNVPVGAGRRRSKNGSKAGSEEQTEGGDTTARASYVPSPASPSASSCEQQQKASHASTSKKANGMLLQETNTVETQRQALTSGPSSASGVPEACSKVSLHSPPSGLGVPWTWPWPWPCQASHGGVLLWPYQATSFSWPHSSLVPICSSAVSNPNPTTNLGKRPLVPSQQHTKSLKIVHQQPENTALFSAFQPFNPKAASIFQPKSQVEIKKEHTSVFQEGH